MIGQAIVALVVILAVIVGAFITVAVQGGDVSQLAGAGAVAVAALGALITAELVRNRRSDR